MSNISKKDVSIVTKYQKILKKFFSVLIMFFVITTTLATVVNSQGTSLNLIKDDLENQNSFDEAETKIIKEPSLKDRLLLLKEKITNFIEKSSAVKDKISEIQKDEMDIDNDFSFPSIKSINSPVLRSFERLLRLRLLNLTIMFYTNYSGIEKQVDIKFLQVKKIDVNDDGKDDIKVKLGLSFSIERFLHFSINFKSLITRLPDFPDTLAHFEAYSELYFPGLLFIKQRGDRIRFGYESPEGEEVPSNCQIIYRYLPNIIYLIKKPEHRIEISPGKNNNNSKLILLLGYTNFNNVNKTIVSELNSRVIYTPAVESTVSIGGNGILGGSTFEFARQYSEESSVDMYCSFQKNNITIIGYVKNLPKKVTFTINFGRDGNIVFDTHNQVPSEIGVCNDFYNPDFKVYFKGLPSKAVLNWNIRALIQQKLDLNFYTNSLGISLKGDIKFPNNSTANFTIFSKEKLDCQATLDLKNGYFVFKRNKVDISVDLEYNNINTSIIFSTNISSFYDEPFEIFFGKLFDGNSEVLFHGSYIEISDLYFLFSKSTSNQTSEPTEQFLMIQFSSLRLTSRDFIKFTTDNETKNLILSGGGNASVKLNDLIIKSNLLKISHGSEMRLGLFEIGSDNLYGSAINVSLNLSDIKNFSVETVAYENAISKLIIEGFSIKSDINELINLTEFKINFSGSGLLQLIYHNKSSIKFTGVISGPGLFEIEVVNFNLLNSSIVLLLEDSRISGPTTFFIYIPLEFNQSKLTNYSFIAGVNTQWHVGKFYAKIFIPLIEIINLNGIGQASIGFEKCPIGGITDFIFSLNGEWDWKKIYFIPLSEEWERPGIQVGSFSGNFTVELHIPNLKEIGKGHFNGAVYSDTKLDQFKLEGSTWSISAISLQMKPGDFYIFYEFLGSGNMHFLINNSGTIDLEFDTFLIENKNTGKNFSFKSREISAPYLEIKTNLNLDGDGFLYLDTNNQYCNYEITKSELVKINRTFRANNCNISWNFSGGLFNIIDISGFIELGKTFEILVFIKGQWRVLISINEPVAEFTWSPSQPNANDTIQFDASESYFTNPITRYDWKWFSTDVWHNNLGAFPTYSYNQNGSYKVTLRVWSGLKHSTCTKTVYVGEVNVNLNIIYSNVTLIEGCPFEILLTDIENNNAPLSGVTIIYSQIDCYGNWQNTTSITNSDGIAGFIAFDVPKDDDIKYSDAKVFLINSDFSDVESKWFRVHDSTIK